MASIYIVRHQANGFVHEFPFSSPPTDEQKAAIGRLCFQRHGFGHVKTPSEPYWLKVVEVPLLGPSDVPDVPERDLSTVPVAPGEARAELPTRTVSGSGHVTEGKV